MDGGDSAICDIVDSNYMPTNFICTPHSSICINENRNIVSFGKNNLGYLGHDNIDAFISSPKQIPNLINIKMVACGCYHTAVIDYDGNIFTFGSNEFKQLGIGKDKTELLCTHVPQKLTNIPPIDFISCGYSFTMCITNDRTVYSFGQNNFGQLGLGNHISDSLPQLIPILSNIEFIACGIFHTICKTYSNEYYSWGSNFYGQLGQGNSNKLCDIPFKCSNWPDDIVDIKCGLFHVLLLTSKGFVYSFGSNKLGQLGLNDIKSKIIPTLIKDIPLIKRIEIGSNHSMCIDINDKLWIFGDNRYGQLGLGDKEDRCKPTLNESLHDIIDISSGGHHTLVKTLNNEIYAFGNNEFSQLGLKISEKHQSTPIQVFKDNEDMWAINIKRSKQKSARK